jgi:Tfp pilus assembly protein PilF
MVIAKDPRETKAYYSLAMVYFMKSDYEKTTDILSRAILLNPNFAKAYNGRGQSYMKSGNIGKAIPDFQKACEMGENCGCIMLDLISKKEKQQP